jgi:hypothetical protein
MKKYIFTLAVLCFGTHLFAQGNIYSSGVNDDRTSNQTSLSFPGLHADNANQSNTSNNVTVVKLNKLTRAETTLGLNLTSELGTAQQTFTQIKKQIIIDYFLKQSCPETIKGRQYNTTMYSMDIYLGVNEELRAEYCLPQLSFGNMGEYALFDNYDGSGMSIVILPTTLIGQVRDLITTTNAYNNELTQFYQSLRKKYDISYYQYLMVDPEFEHVWVGENIPNSSDNSWSFATTNVSAEPAPENTHKIVRQP